jgi:hypothetical protein
MISGFKELEPAELPLALPLPSSDPCARGHPLGTAPAISIPVEVGARVGSDEPADSENSRISGDEALALGRRPRIPMPTAASKTPKNEVLARLTATTR